MDRGTTSAAVAGALAALVGGLLWVLAWAGVGPLAWWPGAVLLVLAAVAVGAGLVDRGAAPLRLVVGLCLAVLGWALLAVVGGGSGVVDGDAAARVDGLVGAVAALLGLLVLGRELRRRHRGDRPGTRAARRTPPGRRRTGGAHAG